MIDSLYSYYLSIIPYDDSHMHYKMWERSRYWLPLAEKDFLAIEKNQALLEKQLKEEEEYEKCKAPDDDDDNADVESSDEVRSGGEDSTEQSVALVKGDGIHVIVNRVNELFFLYSPHVPPTITTHTAYLYWSFHMCYRIPWEFMQICFPSVI
jgi:hypothetical protein